MNARNTETAAAAAIALSLGLSSFSAQATGNLAGQGSGIGTGSRALKVGANDLPYEVYSDAAWPLARMSMCCK